MNKTLLIATGIAIAGAFLLNKAYNVSCAIDLTMYNIPQQASKMMCMTTESNTVIMSLAGMVMLWYGLKKAIDEI